ncbi:MAG TPA: DUF3800 domain-containing protein [Caldisericia bacterium]|nr:DUF3800 domain-containing protein [Caldisericia bacterium]HOL83024.1 DUF3800 domain-containing protein [Caldisericia bacterium]HPP43753.1 DUF3800 domain-containing protein [Caldisericia bacterium]
MNEKVLYIFVDEAGNFDFSKTGTKYFVLTSFSSLEPLYNRDKLLYLKYDLWENNLGLEYFHASEDKDTVKNKVFEFIKSINNNIEIDSVIIQKNKTNPKLYENETKKEKGKKVYELSLKCLLKYIFNRYKNLKLTKIIIVLSSIFDNNKRELILKTIKKFLKENFNISFNIYFFDSKSDINCQIIDYISWAIYRKWEKDDLKSYNYIKEIIKSEFDMFKTGIEIYY